MGTKAFGSRTWSSTGPAAVSTSSSPPPASSRTCRQRPQGSSGSPSPATTATASSRGGALVSVAGAPAPRARPAVRRRPRAGQPRAGQPRAGRKRGRTLRTRSGRKRRSPRCSPVRPAHRRSARPHLPAVRSRARTPVPRPRRRPHADVASQWSSDDFKAGERVLEDWGSVWIRLQGGLIHTDPLPVLRGCDPVSSPGRRTALEQGTLIEIMPNDLLRTPLEEVQVWLRSASG